MKTVCNIINNLVDLKRIANTFLYAELQ